MPVEPLCLLFGAIGAAPLTASVKRLACMNSDNQGFLIYMIAVAAVSVLAHIFIRKFWITCVALACGCSILNIVHEAVRHDFNIRPSELAFWIPTEFSYGAVMAFPIALLVGLPFHLNRRRRLGV